MKVLLAKTAGFCFGVGRAVDKVFALSGSEQRLVTLGPLIHNPDVTARLAARGVGMIERVEDAQPDQTVVVRTHGVPKSCYTALEQRGIPYVDVTCPFVEKIHRIVAEADETGMTVLIFGHHDHPEVEGICGFCREFYVFSSEEELLEIDKKHPELRQKRIKMVSQTTMNAAIWHKCCNFAKKIYTNLFISDTICIATDERQHEAAEIAARCDHMVVIGGKSSSNTTRLFEVCRAICPSQLIESAEELDYSMLRADEVVGVTAGASTPDYIIQEVCEKLSEVKMSMVINDEMNFEEALEATFKTLNTGDRVTGTIVKINPTEIQVDLGTKQSGYIPVTELSADPNAKPEDLVKVGDEIELFVVRVNDVEGTIMLSRRKIDAEKGWETIKSAEGTDTVLEGTVSEVVKGGIIVVSNGSKVFIPASQVPGSRDADHNALKGTTVKFKILEINDRRRRAVGSIRAVARDARKAAEEKFWSAAEVGQVFKGVVKSITSYGAFVDLGGIDGMVHVSELSWGRIKHPSDVVKVGDELEVYIKALDPEKKRISLGYKKDEDNPWIKMENEYHVGDVVPVTIVKFMTFGAFAEIIPGIQGLIHISQIADRRIEKPADCLNIGEVVDAKILAIDLENKKVSLSIRALLQPEIAADDAETADAE